MMFLEAKTSTSLSFLILSDGEVGDIHRFSSPSKLHAFIGLDPSVYHSGNFNARKTKMSNRGSKVLRYALINAAHNVV